MADNLDRESGAEPELKPFDRRALATLDVIADLEVDRLYVLTKPEGSLEFYKSVRNELILWAYTRITNLVVSCGDAQPCVRATCAEVVELGRALDDALLVALDAWHPEGSRYPAPEPSEMEPMEHIKLAGDDMAATGMVWIPTRPVRAGDRHVDAELYCRKPGQPLLLAYSSLPALQAGCGPYQAAAAIDVAQIDEVAFEAGAARVVFDMPLAEDARHPEPVQDWTR
ncbi:SAV_915 family protein [Prauserella muralis]|uniref:Uncharacterized protein n=1 Tax=Prauserella muralis TaxID=588067 RepID=A0A2V4BBE3_9PSEU|nr:SAV_915 family protein [Prauserella muralis]PXY32381.1 hypothetical protein BAY60_08935 [Prauserella muralis]TWE23934.1 hypothetical protein FHX69_5236 [Prauserella muralis]